jgi:hypothetical protein
VRLSAVLVAAPTNGTLVLYGNGSFSFTPRPDFNGPVSFTYRASAAALTSDIATVTINVTAVDDVPVAKSDSYRTDEDTVLNVAAPGVLGNDTDLEGSPLMAGLVSGPASGHLTLELDGSFRYTPAANFNGRVSFSYRASDGTTSSNVTTVAIDVTPVDDVPVANADSYSIDGDFTLNVAAPGLLANDTDAEGSTLSAHLATLPASGSLALNPDGSFSFTPPANTSGPVSFTYRASDGMTQSTPATVTIAVLPVNDVPVARADTYSATAGTALNVVAPGVLGNDYDLEGNTLVAMLVHGPAHGTPTLNGDGSFTYTANAGYVGADSFTYKANDGNLDSNVATVGLSVTLGNISLELLDTPFVGAGQSATVRVALSNAAPAGGAVVTVTSEDTGILGVVAPGTVTIPEGGTEGTVTVGGAATGSTMLRANATGHVPGSLDVTVSNNFISVGGSTTIAQGQTATVAITISQAAPPEGLTVSVTSSDSSVVFLETPFVTVFAGQSGASATLRESSPGMRASSTRRVVRSTRLPTAEPLAEPLRMSPSQCPGTKRASTSAGRAAIGVRFGIWPRFWPLRRRPRRTLRCCRRQPISVRRGSPRGTM